jgi:hypothetical protein
MDEFIADAGTLRFMIAIIGSSVCAGMYVVPLQAMAQRRSPNKVRARLMSAGSVLLNASVNIITFGLIGLSFTTMKPATPFLAIVIVSAPVSLYAVYKFFKTLKEE